MTDNEIIKAYGCCNLSHDECGGCDNCPCKIEGDCIVPSGFELEREVFNLLHRQKAEIERLKDYPKCVYEYDGDITDYCLKTPCPNYKTVDAIRAEAVKEFAEELIYKIVNTPTKFESTYYMYREGIAFRQNEIIDIIKEMAGEIDV